MELPRASRVAEGGLAALYEEVGFARSLLAYELPDGRLKLIDGHLRREIDPDMEVEVEMLDVSEAEARALLLSIDPLVELGRMQEQLYERLRENTVTKQPELEADVGRRRRRNTWRRWSRRGRQSHRTQRRSTCCW